MKKPLKILYIILSVVVVLIIVVVLAVTLFAGAAVKIGVETAGTRALSVPVTLGDVDLSVFRGRLGLQNLVISNPPGYKNDRLLELKDGRVAVDIRSLLTDTVNVQEIKLDGINLVLEQKDITQNNLHEIIKAVPKGEPKTEEPAEKPGKKLRIDYLEITNVTVTAKLPSVPGKPDTVTLELDPITMTNLGRDEKLDTAILVGKVLLAIESSVAEQGTGVLPDEIMDQMKETWTEAATEKGKELIEEGKEILEGFKGLFEKEQQQ